MARRGLPVQVVDEGRPAGRAGGAALGHPLEVRRPGPRQRRRHRRPRRAPSATVVGVLGLPQGRPGDTRPTSRGGGRRARSRSRSPRGPRTPRGPSWAGPLPTSRASTSRFPAGGPGATTLRARELPTTGTPSRRSGSPATSGRWPPRIDRNPSLARAREDRGRAEHVVAPRAEFPHAHPANAHRDRARPAPAGWPTQPRSAQEHLTQHRWERQCREHRCEQRRKPRRGFPVRQKPMMVAGRSTRVADARHRPTILSGSPCPQSPSTPAHTRVIAEAGCVPWCWRPPAWCSAS